MTDIFLCVLIWQLGVLWWAVGRDMNTHLDNQREILAELRRINR